MRWTCVVAVLAACDGGERPSAVAERFQVARATVYLWLKPRRDEGRTEAKRLGGGPKPTIRDAAEAALVRLVEDRGDRTLAEYADELAAAPAPGGVRVHPWTVGRALRRLGRTRKKKTMRATEQDEAAVAAARQAWPAALAGIDPARLVFIDESAALTDMVRAH
jgi:transposase